MVESKVPPKLSSTNERPSTVRRRNTELHARVNGNLTFEFTDAKLTSYAGLELFDPVSARELLKRVTQPTFSQ